MRDSCEAEGRRIRRWIHFQLPHSYKKVGIWSSLLIIALMIAKRFVAEPIWAKPLLSSLLIVAMLMVSLSKEKIEDEWITSLRALSYRWAFVMGVLYALIQPYINYAVDFILGSDQPQVDTGYFPVLVFMLLVQLLCFHQLKRTS